MRNRGTREPELSSSCPECLGGASPSSIFSIFRREYGSFFLFSDPPCLLPLLSASPAFRNLFRNRVNVILPRVYRRTCNARLGICAGDPQPACCVLSREAGSWGFSWIIHSICIGGIRAFLYIARSILDSNPSFHFQRKNLINKINLVYIYIYIKSRILKFSKKTYNKMTHNYKSEITLCTFFDLLKILN